MFQKDHSVFIFRAKLSKNFNKTTAENSKPGICTPLTLPVLAMVPYRLLHAAIVLCSTWSLMHVRVL